LRLSRICDIIIAYNWDNVYYIVFFAASGGVAD
jgi:hypothetical protein